MPVELGSFDAIIGMDWLAKYQAIIMYAEKIVRIPWGNEILIIHGDGSNRGNETPYHPQTTGKAERTIQTLEDMLRACAIDFGKGWVNHLPAEVGEAQTPLVQNLILRDDEKIVQIKKRMQAARDRQKSYADLKRKPMEFQVGDKVMLKVSPWKGVARFGKRRKLNLIYLDPFSMWYEMIGSDA
ncbi:putative reverse transcriptase domain-containing protein [Tanacetum coccineum]|uniref:Reverse transcriptase domain-containing protein n=1 Tax=Tanacetum coccineum TaxID=301880 RepID=A0ABQ5AAD6_9ASTR